MLFQIRIQDQEMVVELERPVIIVSFKEKFDVKLDVIKYRTLAISTNKIRKVT